MAFSDDEKVKIRAHLGYMQTGDAYTFVLGLPSSLHTAFLLEGAMERVIPAAEKEARRLIQILDAIECNDLEALDTIDIAQVGEIAFKADGDKRRQQVYRRWQGALGNLFGVQPYAYDQRGGGGINARMNHG